MICASILLKGDHLLTCFGGLAVGRRKRNVYVLRKWRTSMMMMMMNLDSPKAKESVHEYHQHNR